MARSRCISAASSSASSTATRRTARAPTPSTWRSWGRICRPSPPPVLIPRDRRLGIAERMTAAGTTEQALAAPAVAALVDRLVALEVETVAIALINAFVNPAHERQLRDAIAAALPDLPVAL